MKKLNVIVKRKVLGENQAERKRTDMEMYVKMFESSPSFKNGENPFISNLSSVVPTIEFSETTKFNYKHTKITDEAHIYTLKSDESRIQRKQSAFYNPISFIKSQLSHNNVQRKKIIRVVDGTRDHLYFSLIDKYSKDKNKKNIKIYQKKSDSTGCGILTNRNYEEIIEPIVEEKSGKEKVFKFQWEKDIEIKWKPEIHEGGTLVTVNGLIYMYGGISRSLINEVTVLDFSESSINLESMQWKKVKVNGDIPPWGRTGHTMCKWKKGFVIFGGEKDFNQILRIRDCFSDAKYFSTEKNEWTSMRVNGDILEARRNHSACIIGKFMVVSGGMNNHGKILSDFYSLSLESLKWEQLDIATEDKHPFDICFHTSCSIFRGEPKVYALYNPFDFVKEKKLNKVKEEGIYIFGGKSSQGINGNLAILKIGSRPLRLEYPKTKGIPPSGRYQHCMHYYKPYNILIIYGGRIDGDFEDPIDALQPNIHVLNLETLNWCSVSTFGLTQTHKCAFASTIFESKLIVFGGVNFHKYIEQEIFYLELDQNKTRMMALRTNPENSKDEEEPKESSIFSETNLSRNKLPYLETKTDANTPIKNFQSFAPIPTKQELRRTSTKKSTFLNPIMSSGRNQLARTSSIKKFLDIVGSAGGFLSTRKVTN